MHLQTNTCKITAGLIFSFWVSLFIVWEINELLMVCALWNVLGWCFLFISLNADKPMVAQHQTDKEVHWLIKDRRAISWERFVGERLKGDWQWQKGNSVGEIYTETDGARKIDLNQNRKMRLRVRWNWLKMREDQRRGSCNDRRERAEQEKKSRRQEGRTIIGSRVGVKWWNEFRQENRQTPEQK